MSEPSRFLEMVREVEGHADTTAEAISAVFGKKIAKISITDEDEESSVVIEFETEKLKLVDWGQQSDEARYMRTDDDLGYFLGAQFLGFEVKPVDEEGHVEFLEIRTSAGSFIISCHNDHNGWYGGFNVVALLV